MKSVQQSRVTAPRRSLINYSAYDARSFGGLTALLAQCREGVTSVVFVQDHFYISAMRRDSFDITTGSTATG